MSEDPSVLVAMRLKDMRLVHPDQDNSRRCHRCRRRVGIYPSGQKALRLWPRLKIQCARCTRLAESDIGVPAAETLDEYRAERRASIVKDPDAVD